MPEGTKVGSIYIDLNLNTAPFDKQLQDAKQKASGGTSGAPGGVLGAGGITEGALLGILASKGSSPTIGHDNRSRMGVPGNDAAQAVASGFLEAKKIGMSPATINDLRKETVLKISDILKQQEGGVFTKERGGATGEFLKNFSKSLSESTATVRALGGAFAYASAAVYGAVKVGQAIGKIGENFWNAAVGPGGTSATSALGGAGFAGGQISALQSAGGSSLRVAVESWKQQLTPVNIARHQASIADFEAKIDKLASGDYSELNTKEMNNRYPGLKMVPGAIANSIYGYKEMQRLRGQAEDLRSGKSGTTGKMLLEMNDFVSKADIPQSLSIGSADQAWGNIQQAANNPTLVALLEIKNIIESMNTKVGNKG